MSQYQTVTKPNNAIDFEKSPRTFRLATQLLSKGRSDRTLAQTDFMSVRIKCYAQGGENVLHSHPGEDHAFIILDGEADFFGKNGEIGVLSKGQGIILPRGCFYKFKSCGDTPLVLLRLGAEKEKLPTNRVGADGKSLPGNSKANKHEDGVPIEGVYYDYAQALNR
jgi:mannose-6-phosphate isomerase-like protein (cupin superfamily)